LSSIPGKVRLLGCYEMKAAGDAMKLLVSPDA